MLIAGLMAEKVTEKSRKLMHKFAGRLSRNIKLDVTLRSKPSQLGVIRPWQRYL